MDFLWKNRCCPRGQRVRKYKNTHTLTNDGPKLEGPGYYLDRRLSARQRQGGSGVRLAGRRELGRRELGRRALPSGGGGVFDAGVCAICRALRIFEARQQTGEKYTIFSDPQPAIRRTMSDSLGPGQQWARAIIEVATRLMASSNEVRILWVPAHSGIRGNEVADSFAKEAAENRTHDVPDEIRWQTSLPHLSRRATEGRARATSQWVRDLSRPWPWP